MYQRGHTVFVQKRNTKRLFLVISLNKSWITSLIAVQQSDTVRSITHGISTRWTTPHNFHLTVRFIGMIDEQCIPCLIEYLKELRTVQRFSLPFAGIETATVSDPKMIWARFVNTSEFSMLVSTVTKIITRFFSRECRGMRLMSGHEVLPHITVARCNGELPQHVRFDSDGMPKTFDVASVSLYISQVEAIGSVYQRVAIFRLYKKGAV